MRNVSLGLSYVGEIFEMTPKLAPSTCIDLRLEIRIDTSYLAMEEHHR